MDDSEKQIWLRVLEYANQGELSSSKVKNEVFQWFMRRSTLIECKNCKKLVLPRRLNRKKFCSARCCSQSHERSKPRQLRTDSIWVWRLEKKMAATPNPKLCLDGETRLRLSKIRKKWPTLKERASSLASAIRSK
jgi:hypothetical protein